MASAAEFLGDSRKHLGAGSLGHGLGIHQAQAGQLANDLDGLDLLGASIFQNDVEFSLLFDRFGSRGGGRGTGGGDGYRSGGGNAPLLFEFLNQVGSFQNCQLAQFFY